MTDTPMTADEATGDVYFVRKNGYYYRPNSRGYTSSPLEAGRYSKEDAETHIDERAGVSIVRASEVMPDMLDRKAPDGLREAVKDDVLDAMHRVNSPEGELDGDGYDDVAETATDYILALIQPAVKVKALRWVQPPSHYWQASQNGCAYRITEYAGMATAFYLEGIAPDRVPHHTLEAAKAAAQAHYDAAIREALEPCPDHFVAVTNMVTVPDDMVMVPQSAIDYIMGTGPDHEGYCFGSSQTPGKGNFRWRSRFRAMLSAALTTNGET